MMRSKRRIHLLSIEGNFYSKLNNFDRLISVINHFGCNVRQLQLSRINFSFKIFPKFLQALNLMSNLEKISLLYVEGISMLKENFELRLYKLKEIESYGSTYEFLRIFNCLPPGILKKVKLHNFENLGSGSRPEKLFENQQNIEEVHSHKGLFQLLNLAPLNLKTLIINDKVDIGSALKNQKSLRKLSIECIESGDLKLISESPALEELKASVNGLPSAEFADFKRLKNLKKLDVACSRNVNEALDFLQHQRLEELKIYCYSSVSEETMTALGRQLPMLRKLHLYTRSPFDIINSILRHFHNLEILEFDNRFYDDEILEQFTYQEGLVNQKLKNLSFKTKFIFNDFPKLIACCKKLEELETFAISDVESIRDVLISQPHLKKLKLSLDSWNLNWCQPMTRNFLDVLEQHGRQLKHFQCVVERFDNDASIDRMRGVFGNQFSIIAVQPCMNLYPVKYFLMMTNDIKEIEKMKRFNPSLITLI